MAAMIEVKHVGEVGALGQDAQARERMLRKEANHRPRITGQRIERHAVLQFAQVERLGPTDLAGLAVDLGQDVVQVHVDFHGRRESHPLCASEVAILTAVGTESVWREVPEVGARVVLFRAAPQAALMYAKDQRAPTFVVQGQRIGLAQVDLVVRRIKLLDNLGADKRRRCDRRRSAVQASRRSLWSG